MSKWKFSAIYAWQFSLALSRKERKSSEWATPGKHNPPPPPTQINPPKATNLPASSLLLLSLRFACHGRNPLMRLIAFLGLEKQVPQFFPHKHKHIRMCVCVCVWLGRCLFVCVCELLRQVPAFLCTPWK